MSSAIRGGDHIVAPADEDDGTADHQVTLPAGSGTVDVTFPGRTVEVTFDGVLPPRDRYMAGVATGPVTVRFTFSEPVEGFTREDIEGATHDRGLHASLACGCVGDEIVQPRIEQPDPGLLAVEGPDLDSLRSPALELFELSTSSSTRRQIIVSGELTAGPVLEFRVARPRQSRAVPGPAPAGGGRRLHAEGSGRVLGRGFAVNGLPTPPLSNPDVTLGLERGGQRRARSGL
ncbi:hypothetical protein [Candidatus Palauibacter sp.]|uniref:hypothetical protein n=1 Tax=Candidatus Palauibacter sp. TaxID=3101350 RepID=UPI003B028080